MTTHPHPLAIEAAKKIVAGQQRERLCTGELRDIIQTTALDPVMAKIERYLKSKYAHATNHIHDCTGSNEPGQLGSEWGELSTEPVKCANPQVHQVVLHGTIVEPEIAIQRARADEWKAMAGRLAEALAVHKKADDEARKFWQLPESEWQRTDKATLKAFDDLMRREG